MRREFSAQQAQGAYAEGIAHVWQCEATLAASVKAVAHEHADERHTEPGDEWEVVKGRKGIGIQAEWRQPGIVESKKRDDLRQQQTLSPKSD